MKKKLRLIAAVLVLVLIWCGAINCYIVSFSSEKISKTISGNYDCILILGCGVLPSGEPTLMLKDRLESGISLYKSGASKKLIMSGDHGTEGYDEVNAMRSYAISKGVAEEDIFMDHAGFSTYESMYRARDVFMVKSMIIVTQEYHLSRAIFDADKLGIRCVGFPADKYIYRGQTLRDIREVLARNKDFLWCIFKPKPKFLGEAIPVSGSGLKTIG